MRSRALFGKRARGTLTRKHSKMVGSALWVESLGKTHRIPMFAIDELKARQGGERRVGIGILVGVLVGVVLGQAIALL